MSLLGKVFENKSHWNKDGKDKVVIVAHDHRNKKYYVQHILTGVVDWVDESGNGQHYECGGTWLKVDLTPSTEQI